MTLLHDTRRLIAAIRAAFHATNMKAEAPRHSCPACTRKHLLAASSILSDLVAPEHIGIGGAKQAGILFERARILLSEARSDPAKYGWHAALAEGLCVTAEEEVSTSPGEYPPLTQEWMRDARLRGCWLAESKRPVPFLPASGCYGPVCYVLAHMTEALLECPPDTAFCPGRGMIERAISTLNFASFMSQVRPAATTRSDVERVLESMADVVARLTHEYALDVPHEPAL